MRAILTLALLASACSETNVNARTEIAAPACDGDPPAAYVPPTHATCEREPDIGPFDPVVEWQWTANPTHPTYAKVEIPPIVAHLDDDDGDGAIGPGDVPDLVFSAFRGTEYTGFGKLVMLSGVDGAQRWSLAAAEGKRFYSLAGVAVGRVDDSGVPAIFATADRSLVRLTPDGEVVWVTPAAVRGAGFDAPAIADIDGDGTPEIVLGSQVFAADGTRLSGAPDDTGTNYHGSFPADLDDDGVLEIVVGGGVLEWDSRPRWRDARIHGWPAVGDLDGDGTPEVITVHRSGLHAFSVDGTPLWSSTWSEGGGGPPTVADFDGDGMAEIGVAAKKHYRVYEGDGTLLWKKAIVDGSSGITGSSVFDFEGDGAAEVVYSDEGTLWVLDGSTGTVELEWTSHNSGTRFEYPVVVDVDADGSAEIVLGSGRDMHGTRLSGITVIGSRGDTWAPARDLWNQHAYHITNVADDLSIPEVAEPAWGRWNSFRAANSETPHGLFLSNLVPRFAEVCVCERGSTSVWLPVENRGLADVDTIMLQIETRTDGDWTSRGVMIEAGIAAGEVRWLGPYDFDLGDGQARFTVDPEDHEAECNEDDNVVVHDIVGCGDR